MGVVGQAVDYGTRGVRGQLDGRLMAVGADDDHVGVLAQHAAEIGDALAPSEPDVSAQEQRVPPRWTMLALKLTRVRSDGFSKTRAIRGREGAARGCPAHIWP